MKRRELAEKLLENINEIEDTEEKLKWVESFCNEIIDNFWVSRFITRVSDVDLGSYPACGLCGDTGVIHSKCYTPKGIQIDAKFFCICPNGQSLHKLGRDPTLCYSPSEKDFNKKS